MNPLRVNSEIGNLRKVVLHRPGKELENLTPKWLEELLFDDIPWLDLARKEHDTFADKFREAGVEVYYLTDLASESLSTLKIKKQFINQFIEESNVFSETLRDIVRKYLLSIPTTKEMIEITMTGIKKQDLPNYSVRTLSDYIKDYPFVTDPMPNLYFTRDPFSIIGTGVSLSKMYKDARRRESIYGEYIFKYHPMFKNESIPIHYHRDSKASLEGGDIVVLSKEVVAVGISERTHPAAIEKLAKSLLYQYPSEIHTILAFDIPKTRAYMHLDTVFTQVDVDKFLIHHDFRRQIKVYALTKHPKKENKLKVKPIDKTLKDVLSIYLNRKITLIPCGGSDTITSDREQWNDGANTICIRPGEVIVYERNHVTNDILKKHGIKCYTIPSSELSRGRGGPRCMSMPLFRDEIDNN